MQRESSRRGCDGLAAAMRAYGVPEEILTDNGKVLTGRFNRPAVEPITTATLGSQHWFE